MVARVLISPGVIRVSKPGIAVSPSTPDDDLIFNPMANRYNGCVQAGQVLWGDMTVTTPVAGQTQYTKTIALTETYTDLPRCLVAVWSDYYEGGELLESFNGGANHLASGSSWRCNVNTRWWVTTTHINFQTTLNDISPPYPLPEHRWNYSYLIFIV